MTSQAVKENLHYYSSSLCGLSHTSWLIYFSKKSIFSIGPHLVLYSLEKIGHKNHQFEAKAKNIILWLK